MSNIKRFSDETVENFMFDWLDENIFYIEAFNESFKF